MTPSSILFTVVFASTLVAVPALAARQLPTFRPLTRSALLDASANANESCQLGVTGPVASTVSYVIPPDDQYYTLLDPTVGECAEHGSAQLTAAHIGVEFAYAYDTPIRVGIVEADMSDPGCPVPIPGAYLCEPVEYSLQGPGTGAYDVELPVPTGCAINGMAFLEITFTEWNSSYEVPGLLLSGECEACTSWNFYPGNDYDLCTFGFEGNPIMYVNAIGDAPVAAERSTWGRLKTIYH